MKIISCCPSCNHTLIAKKLLCPSCGIELANDFELSPFDCLKDSELQFLVAFLKSRGNLKSLQDSFGISYITAKKQLEQVLISLNLTEKPGKEELDMSLFRKSPKNDASSIIRNKMIEANGHADIKTYNGIPYTVYLSPDGKGVLCEALPNISYEFRVFDCIVALLEREGGKAKKGQARNNKVGAPTCNEHTVTGVIALDYFGKSYGDSVFDPVFILAAILEWADIAKNRRGYLELTENYKRMVGSC